MKILPFVQWGHLSGMTPASQTKTCLMHSELDCDVLVHGKGCMLPKASSYGLTCVACVFKVPLKKIYLLQ